MLDVVQLKWLVMLTVDLGPVTEVRGAIKGQVRHCLWEHRKVTGSLFEDKVPLTKKE